MKIDDDHFYHGAGLVQIAEHEEFKAINALKVGGVRCETAFLINTNTGVYMRYRREKTPSFDEHVFKFSDDAVKELAAIKAQYERVFLGLVCVNSKEICCLPYDTFTDLLNRRRTAEGTRRSVGFDLIVALRSRQQFRVYVNAPRRRGRMLGDEEVIPRADFPNALFAR